MKKLLSYLNHKRKDLPAAIGFLIVSVCLVLASVWAWNEYFTSAPYVDTERYPIRGIDISAHNGMMNLDAAAADGVAFAFIKASEGISFRDENFSINYKKAGHAGIKRGAYHYFRFDCDGVKQAINLLSVVRNRQLELGIAIDVEDHGNASDVPPELIQQRLQDMVEYLNLMGRRVMFYTNREGYEKYLMDNYPGYPLWICHFSETPFDADWTFWQYDHHGKVKGIRGDVDLDVFIGSHSDWEQYLSQNQ